MQKRETGVKCRMYLPGLLIAVVMLLSGCGSSGGEEADSKALSEPTQNPATVEETTVVERTILKTVMEEAEEPEEADAVVGERLNLDGIDVLPFVLREERTIHYYSSPASSALTSTSEQGGYVLVDYAAGNREEETRDFVPEAVMTDAEGNTYEVAPEIEAPTENSGGTALDPGEDLASTLIFEVDEGAEPESLTLAFGGEERTVDLTKRDVSSATPGEYMSIYHLWFNQRAYDEIYALFDPDSTRGISEAEWTGYMDGLWGNWFLSYDDSNVVSESTSEASVEIGRSFYEPGGAVTRDTKLQELVREGDEWRLVMRQDQVDDVLEASGYVPPSDDPVPEDASPEDAGPEYSAPAVPLPEESTAAPVEQYDPPAPDPDRPYVPNSPEGPGNEPNYPSDGYYPGSPDKDCPDFPGGVTVSPGDPYDLDGDGDGTACE